MQDGTNSGTSTIQQKTSKKADILNMPEVSKQPNGQLALVQMQPFCVHLWPYIFVQILEPWSISYPRIGEDELRQNQKQTHL